MEALRKASPLLGDSSPIRELRDFIVGVSLLTEPVLITGPSGSGKTLAIRKIHAVGRTARAPFVRVQCDQYDEQELVQLLFDGNADTEYQGLMRAGSGGTCHIAGIEHLPDIVVTHLTNFLMHEQSADDGQPRLIFSSRLPLDELLRGDLVDSTFVELISSYHTWIPPLRERVEDIPILCSYQVWMNTPVADYEGRWQEFKDEVLPTLISYPWPGNVTELNGVVQGFCADTNCTISNFAASTTPEATTPEITAPEFTDVSPAEYLGLQIDILREEFFRLLEVEELTGENNLILGTAPRRELFQDHAT